MPYVTPCSLDSGVGVLGGEEVFDVIADYKGDAVESEQADCPAQQAAVFVKAMRAGFMPGAGNINEAQDFALLLIQIGSLQSAQPRHQ